MAKEILTPDVIEEIPLEKRIDQTLTKNNVTNRVIAALKEKYGGMQLSSITDKEGYANIKEARKEVRKIGILAEKLCKEGRDEANKIRGLWIDKEKEVLAKIAEVQDPLDAEIKKYDDEQARLEAEEIQRQEERFMSRQTQLLKMGAVYANGCFNLGSISYESNMIKEADEEIFTDTILSKYRAVYEKIETARVEEEKKKEAEAIELKRQQDEFAEKQRLFNEQQEQFKKQQEELQKQKDEATRQENEKKETALKAKCVRLENLGMMHRFQSGTYEYSDITVAKSELVGMDDSTFEGFMQGLTQRVEAKKQELIKEQEEKRAHEIEAAKQKAIREEQERAAEEKRQAEIKAQQEEVKRIEDAAKASDKEKWEAFIQVIGQLLPPTTMKSGIYKSKSSQAVQKLNEIKAL